MPQHKRPAVVRRAVLAVPLVVVVLLAVWSRGCTRWPALYYMTGPSMEPTVRASEVFSATSPAEPLERGMPVLFRYVDEDGEFSVLRRLAGLPGDTVAMRAGRVVVNGTPQPWPFRVVKAEAHRSPLARGGELYDWGPVIVGPDSVFVLADTRDVIGWPDSRFLGPLPLADLIARAGRIVWTPSPGRLFHSLQPASRGAKPR